MCWILHIQFLYLFIAYLIKSALGDPLGISIEPAGAVKPGSNVKVKCNVSSNYADSPITWLRRTGTLEFEIGKDSLLESTLHASGRYIINPVGTTYGMLSTLEITSAKFEDISEIGCSLQQSTQIKPVYVTLSVCSNADSDWCRCIVKQKWADPSCAQEATDASANNSNLKKAVTALAVCLAVAIAYALVMTVLASIDCTARLHQKRQMAEKKAVAQATRNRNPYADSEQLTMDAEGENMMGSQTAEPPVNGNVKIPIMKAEVHMNRSYERDEEESRPADSQPSSNYYRDPDSSYHGRQADSSHHGRQAGSNVADSSHHGRQAGSNVADSSYHGSKVAEKGYNSDKPVSTVTDQYYIDTGMGAGYLPAAANRAADLPPSYGEIKKHNFAQPRGTYTEQRAKTAPQAYPEAYKLSHSQDYSDREPSGPYISPDTSV